MSKEKEQAKFFPARLMPEILKVSEVKCECATEMSITQMRI
jgi:hypothetical protein